MVFLCVYDTLLMMLGSNVYYRKQKGTYHAMRLRNIKGAKDQIAQSPFVIQNPEEYPGKWNQLFQNEHPIYLEIGMGKGKFLTTLAKEHPEHNYIGMERYSSVLIRGIQKQEQLQLPNLVFLRMDAANLVNIFAPGEIAGIYLNFSDPWPKDRHSKRRLTSPVFLNMYQIVLAKDGVIEFKTDNRPLFDFSVESVENTEPWAIRYVTYDLHNSPYNEGNIQTEYEERFSSMGNPIFKLVAHRP